MIIYKITNTENGRMYVGKTIGTLQKRMAGHRCSCNSKTKKNSAPLLYEDVTNHGGWDIFTAEIIDTAETKEELNEKERIWIKKLNTQNGGYNIGFGGDGGDNYAFNRNMDQVRERLSVGVKNSKRWTPERREAESKKRKKWNDEHIDFLRELISGDNNPMAKTEVRIRHLESIRTEEYRSNMSKIIKERYADINYNRKISRYIWLMFDDSGVFLEKYESTMEVRPHIKIAPSSIPIYGKRDAWIDINNCKWVRVNKNENNKEDIDKICRKGI